VLPDPDLCAFWLADRIDERGWGLRGDTFNAMDQLRELGVDVWFNLGDRDLAIGLRRAQRLAEGATLTEAIGELTTAPGAGRARAAHDRPAGAHAACWPRALGGLPGVHDPRGRRGGRSTASSCRASKRRAAPEAVLDAIARAARSCWDRRTR
jgi:LPPG:FO 2-phospho-L-lactate transferase